MFDKVSIKTNRFAIIVFVCFILTLTVLWVLALHNKMPRIRSFVSSLEAKSFDLRQVFLSKHRYSSDEVVIVGIDNISHEYLTKYYGRWPLPRRVYADFIDYVETQNPIAVGLDVLFVSPWHKKREDDLKLANTFSKYDNAFAAIYFDEHSLDERIPLKLPKSLRASIDSDSTAFSPYVYPNLRALYPELISSTPNIGHLNLERASDGVIRTLPLFVEHSSYDEVSSYYYPNFGLKMLKKYLEHKENLSLDSYRVDSDNNLIMGSKTIPMLPSAEVVLNWYANKQDNINSSFTYYSFKDVFQSMLSEQVGDNPKLPNTTFKDKIVIFGYTADGLSDLKTVPNNKLLPGVEIYATFINNVIESNIIKKYSIMECCIISILLAIIVASLLLMLSSAVSSLIFVSAITIIYLWASFWAMDIYHLWIPVVMPVASIIATALFVLAMKYIFKSQDYEYVYKLATTDSLTGLLNHGFFQDQMHINLEYCKRYDHYFSMLLIDIDNFKLFNDNYGHLSGDAVLRQVSQLLKKSVRKADIVCRYGGEEIAIILPNTVHKNAYILAEKLRKLVDEHEFELIDGTKTHVTISLGVSAFPDKGNTVRDVVEWADKVLYVAKENGRNRVGNPDKVVESMDE